MAERHSAGQNAQRGLDPEKEPYTTVRRRYEAQNRPETVTGANPPQHRPMDPESKRILTWILIAAAAAGSLLFVFYPPIQEVDDGERLNRSESPSQASTKPPKK